MSLFSVNNHCHMQQPPAKASEPGCTEKTNQPSPSISSFPRGARDYDTYLTVGLEDRRPPRVYPLLPKIRFKMTFGIVLLCPHAPAIYIVLRPCRVYLYKSCIKERTPLQATTTENCSHQSTHKCGCAAATICPACFPSLSSRREMTCRCVPIQ